VVYYFPVRYKENDLKNGLGFLRVIPKEVAMLKKKGIQKDSDAGRLNCLGSWIWLTAGHSCVVGMWYWWARAMLGDW